MTISSPNSNNKGSDIVTSGGGGLLSINFNQDYSCISVGTKTGYRIYNCEPFTKCYSKGKAADSSLQTLNPFQRKRDA